MYYCYECDEFHQGTDYKFDFNSEESTMDKSLQYIERRIHGLYYGKQIEAQALYMRRVWPKDMGQLKAWLKAGNYILDPEIKDDDELLDTGYAIYWDKKMPDAKAYGDAIDKLNEAKQKALDIINISTDEKIRLDALKDFESYTVH